MTNWIKLEEFSDHFPTEGSVNIHHCKTGLHNDRLYLTRTEDGNVIGYCFHCGGKGVYTPSACDRRALKPGPKQDPTDPFKAWDVPVLDEWYTSNRWHTPDFGKIPLDIRRWWFLAGLYISEYKDLGVKLLDGKMPAIPLCEDNKEVTGLALRTFDKALPKWILLGSKSQAPFTVKTNPQILILTEDYLSAVRCSRLGSALPLMGTNLSTENFKQITNWYKETGGKVVVWLDNDSEAVVHKAKQIYDRLTLLVKCDIILIKAEAKHLTHDFEISEIINNA
jgi:hypothetical protein